MNEDLKNLFFKRKEKFALLKDKSHRIFNRYTVARLLEFVLGVVVVILLARINTWAALLAGLIFMILFIYLVKQSGIFKEKFLKYEFLETINAQEIKRLNYDLSAFDQGDEFVDRNHYYSYDLDIFGEYSLFQYINRTISVPGKKTLARWLTIIPSSEQIIKKQEAVKELSTHLDLLQNFMSEGMFVQDKEEDYKQVSGWLSEKVFFLNKKALLLFIRVFTIITCVLWIAVPFGMNYLLPGACSLFMLFFTGLFLKRINRIHSVISSQKKFAEQLMRLYGIISESRFSCEYLKDIQGLIGDKKSGAYKKLEKFIQLVNLMDNRLNTLAAILLNGLLFWDIRLSFQLEKWKMENREFWPEWIQTLGEFDALVSLASYALLNPDFVYPEIKDQLPFTAREMGHVLIPAHSRVCNDVTIENEGTVMLITGSNMSGKSTFLRATGTNLILAYCGAPVCATYFSTPVIQLFTSMRVSDDLSRQESTFYAELKRFRLMLELNEEMQLFVLLDEILKGTNSRDKYTGSRALIKQLVQSTSIAMVATHDLELSSLEKEHPGKVLNYAFEVLIENGKFHFDYKLKRGVCTVLNASELMKQMGINL